MPSIVPALEWLEGLAWTTTIRESTWGYPMIETAHVASVVAFAGLVIMMDLRLVGVAFTHAPPMQIQRRLFPWQMLGFALIVITGIAIFWSKPLSYYGKGFLWVKMFLFVLAGINAGIIHLLTHNKPESAWNSPAARFAGAASLILWAGVLITGRLVAYEWFTTEYF